MSEQTQINLLKKLRALAEQGVDGEKETADRKYRELLKKYDISEDMIFDDIKEYHEFHFDNIFEKKLAIQLVAVETFPEEPSIYRRRHVRDKVGFDLTKAQFIAIDAKYNFYKEKMIEDLDVAYSAFIHVNKLGRPTYENEEEKEMTAEDLKRLRRVMGMMENMDRHTYYKQLGQHEK